MMVHRSDVITIPKWLVIFAVPIGVTILTSVILFKTVQAKYQEKVENLERANEKKIDKAEAERVFTDFQKQLNRIESKLDQNQFLIQTQ